MVRVIRVLPADDQALVRTGFRMILENAPDMELVGEAGEGAQAAAPAAELRPDVVLMDVRMPDVDRVEATRGICADGTGHARVVILTTFVTEREREVLALIARACPTRRARSAFT